MNIKQAQQAGVQAFNEGREFAPALNQAFICAAAAQSNVTELMDAYTHGYTVASLAKDAEDSMPSVRALKDILS